MWWNFPNIIEFESEKEYLDLFISEYIKKEFITHDWIKINIKEWHFYHIFYRDKCKTTKYFDKRLAKRILQIKYIVESNNWNVEIYEQFNNTKKRIERNYIYVYWKICVFLWQETNWNFYIITAYQKTNKDLEIMRKSKNIKRLFNKSKQP